LKNDEIGETRRKRKTRNLYKILNGKPKGEDHL
jgi:hypothetical protein